MNDYRYHYGPGTLAQQAKREATRCRKMNNRLNPVGECTEFAYSPTTGAVGMRWEDRKDDTFRVFNIYYPMYGRNDEVTDWRSVGVSTPKKAR